MADRQHVTLATTGHLAGSVIVSARGPVTSSTLPELRNGLVKLLAEGVPVVLDVSDLQLDWAPAPEVFVTAVTAAGGWPLARLVLFGAGPHAEERLHACRVPDSVPLARTVDDATARVGTRPVRLSRGVDLPAEPASVRRARAELDDTCQRWGLSGRDDIAEVVTELVTNAVEHARTPFRLRLVLDRSGFRVSVRDRRPGPLADPPDPSGTSGPGGRGLRTVARLSRSWGVLLYGDGKAVWAQLSLTRSISAPKPAVADGRAEVGRAPDDSGVGRTAAVSPPRRRRFTTADPEQAHAFLRSVYGEHTLRLSGAAELPEALLEYDGVTTNRFAIEHLSHGAAVEGLFGRRDVLVVVHPLGGDVRIGSRKEELRAAPGEVVLCGSGTDVLVGSTWLDVEVVRLEAAAVAQVTAELTGFDAPTVPFDLSRPVSPARGAHWRAVVAHLRRDVLANDEVMASPLSRGTVLRNLVAMLVETFPNPALPALDDHGRSDRVAPMALRRAVRFVEEHAGDDIGLADIAAAAGIGARGLQLAFRRHSDLTPLEYLRRVRLDRAHRDLEAASPAEVTVGGIANRWGFPHHGNFSALYLRTYGRSPSVTLRS